MSTLKGISEYRLLNTSQFAYLNWELLTYFIEKYLGFCEEHWEARTWFRSRNYVPNETLLFIGKGQM